MKQSKEKIKKLEALFQLSKEKANTRTSRALSEAEIAALRPIMNFMKAEVPLPQSLIDWLAQLALLYGVPYNHLIADEKLMTSNKKGPANLIRFFYIDMKWVDSMIDGALSIGTHNSKDFKLQQAVHKAFRANIENEMLDLRQKIKGKGLSERTHPEKMGTLSGFLLRSPLVAQWPGIEVRGFNKIVTINDFTAQVQDIDYEPNIMPVLRMERLAADTLLLIFKGVPKSILIKEPAEGVYSGLTYAEKSEEHPAGYRLTLRHLKGKNKIGQPIIKNGSSDEHFVSDGEFRDKAKRVLNIEELRKKIANKYSDPLQPKDMGVLFINSPRYYFYQNPES